MVQKKKPIELPALWETMRELFPDSETRKEKTEELVLKAATKNDDETTLHWIMVLLAPDIDVGLPCEKKIDYLKNLYWLFLATTHAPILPQWGRCWQWHRTVLMLHVVMF